MAFMASSEDADHTPAPDTGSALRPDPEPVLMSLFPEYYELIWARQKTYEFRKHFLAERRVRWYVYLTAPVERLAAVIDLAPAIQDTPEKIAAIAESMRTGNGASVLEYARKAERAFAVPIQRVAEYPGLSLGELRAQLGRFDPPRRYIRLLEQPETLAVCEKIATESPLREMTVEHGGYSR